MLKAMEDYKNQFILILAGYPGEMADFLQANPGLPSRFPVHIRFPDYSVEELQRIADIMLKEREYVATHQAEWKLKQLIEKEKRLTEEAFSNARYVRNLIEKALRAQAVRLLQSSASAPPGRQDLMTLRPEDFTPIAASERKTALPGLFF